MIQTGQAPREELVHKYFVPVPVKPSYTTALVAIACGAALVVVAIVTAAGASAGASGAGGDAGCLTCLAVIGGLPAIIWGGVKAMQMSSAFSAASRSAFPRATGPQMDFWLQQGLEQARHVAPGRLNRHPDEQSLRWGVDTLLFVGSPPLRDYHVQFAYGEDNRLRTSVYKILVVFLSDYRLSTYECVLDMRTGAMVSDATKEYHLQHVDGLETTSDRFSMVVPGQFVPGGMPPPGMHAGGGPLVIDLDGGVAHITTTQTLSLVVAGRRAVELVMGIARAERLQVEGIVDPSSTDSMIHTLREHLRSHHGGVTAPSPQVMPPPLPPLG